MNRIGIFILATVLLCAPVVGAPTTAEIGSQADAYRRLRVLRGHFQGGVWNDDVDRWGGRKHVVMDWLLTKLFGG
ncbi:MAG: hypothetical protein FJX76_12350 [Armatimonadetes bacterium]|nr:hypothetical protein [Armatimonadota bacterium]